MTNPADAPAGGAPDEGAPGHNLPEYSVAEISAALRRTLEDTYGRVRVRGEISGLKRAGSGHVYFAIKDEHAVLDGVCWRGTAARLTQQPEEGMEVICTGKITTYAGRSKYQLIVEDVELAGEGALLKLLEERRKKLAAEGLFDQERKRDLPFLPDVIGVVTSPTGAVIRDILHRLNDRFPRHVLVWPVLVQGEGAAAQVARAIEGFNRLEPGGAIPRPDVLIVARGGGSLEDLMAFNEEIVVRAAAASDIPLISAVGHETDTTLIDFASDRRAPTPTAAAEIAVPVRAELLAQVQDDGRRAFAALTRLGRELRNRLDAAARGLPALPRIVADNQQRLDDWSERLKPALERHARRQQDRLDACGRAFIQCARTGLRHHDGEYRRRSAGLRAKLLTDLIDRGEQRFRSLGGLLESYSYRGVLERGFALVRDPAGAPVKTGGAVAAGQALTIEFHDGRVGATADGEVPPSKKAAPARQAESKKSAPKKAAPKTAKPTQGSLF